MKGAEMEEKAGTGEGRGREEGTETVAQLLFFEHSPPLPLQRLEVPQSSSGRGEGMWGAQGWGGMENSGK